MKKRFLSMLLVLTMVLSLVPGFTISASATAGGTDYTTAKDYLDNNGVPGTDTYNGMSVVESDWIYSYNTDLIADGGDDGKTITTTCYLIAMNDEDKPILIIGGTGDMPNYHYLTTQYNSYGRTPWCLYNVNHKDNKIVEIRVEEGVSRVGGYAFFYGKEKTVILPENCKTSSTSFSRNYDLETIYAYESDRVELERLTGTNIVIQPSSSLDDEKTTEILFQRELENITLTICEGVESLKLYSYSDGVQACLTTLVFEPGSNLENVNSTLNGNTKVADLTGLTTVTGASASTLATLLSSPVIQNSPWCKGLESTTDENGFTVNSLGSLTAYSGTAANITIPNDVIAIAPGVFFNNSNIESVKIPKSVIAIGERAFLRCRNLETVTFEGASEGISQLQVIKDFAFAGTAITEITLPASLESIGNGAFVGVADDFKLDSSYKIFSGAVGEAIGVIETVTIIDTTENPSQLKYIGDFAFNSCRSLTSINVPNSVNTIGKYCFRQCRNLKSINIPEGIRKISGYSFVHCESLTEITIPSTVTAIGDWAFEACNNITELRIPASVQSIGSASFAYEGTSKRSLYLDCTSFDYVDGTWSTFYSISDTDIYVKNEATRTALIDSGVAASKIHIYEATVGTKGYPTLSEAAAAANGESVTLLSDVTLNSNISANIVIPEDLEITLNLNGYELTTASGDAITNNGRLIITGNGTVSAPNGSALVNNGSMTVVGGTYTSDPTEYVPLGYKATKSAGLYTVGIDTQQQSKMSGTKIVYGSDFVGELVDGTGGKTIVTQYVAPDNVDATTQDEIDTAASTFSVGDGNTVLDTIEVNLYVNNGGTLTKITDAELSQDIEVLVPYADAVPGETYTLYHWNGSGFDGPITAEVVTISSVNYLKFSYNKFSPFIIVGGVGYNTVTATTGEGYTVTYAATAKNGDDYNFTVTVDSGYTLSSVKANGHAFTATDATYVKNSDTSYTIKTLNDNYNIEVKVTKDAATTYDVTFDNSGADQNVQNLTGVVENTTITLPGAVTKSGSTFKGWKNGTDSKIYAAGTSFKVTAAVTFTAEFTTDAVPATYDVTFVTTGANETVQNLTGVAENTYITLPAGLTKANATFDGWYITGTPGTLYAAGSTYKVSAAVEFTAKFTDVVAPETKTVTFTATGADQTVQGLTVVKDSVITLPAAVTKANAEFVGWEISGTVYAAGSQYKVTADVTFTAKFVDAVTYTVTFDKNGADQTVANMTNVAKDSTITLPGALTKANAEFVGWRTGTEVYAAGSAYKVTGAVTFTAEFKAAAKNNVSYVDGKSNGAAAATAVYVGDYVTVNAAPAAVSGFTFKGWQSNVGGTIYQPEQKFQMPATDVILTAVWEANAVPPTTYTVTYDMNGADSAAITDPATYIAGNVVTVSSTIPTKANSVFDGWILSYGSAKLNAGASFGMPATNVTLTAQWKSNSKPSYVVATDPVSGVYNETYTGAVTAKTDDAYGTPVTSGFYLVDADNHVTAAFPVDGLTLHNDGTITGTPTKVGTFEFYVRLADGNGDWISDARKLSITVGKASPAVDTAPTATAVYGTAAKDIAAPTGGTVKHEGAVVDGTWAWTANTAETIFSVGTAATINATFTPTDTTIYNTVTYDVTPTITAKALTLIGELVPVTTGSTVSEDDVKALLVLDGIIAGDTVEYTAIYTIDSADYTTAADAAAALTTLAVTDGSYTVTVAPSITNANYSVTGTADGTLTACTPYYGTPTPAPTTYTITASAAENGTVEVSTKSAASGKTVTVTVTPDEGYEFASILATDASGKAVVLTTVQVGSTYTFTMPASKVTVSASFKETETVVVNPFTDVKEGDYYYDAVLWAVENEITSGTGVTTFSPTAECNRAQMVTFLWRAAGSPKAAKTDCPFTDVDKDAYYYEAVLWAVENGITSGTSDTTFAPDDTVNRAQAVTFLYRLANEKLLKDTENAFTDVAQDAFYADAVAWAAENGITSGTSDTTFSPADACLRGQIVTFLYRYFVK